MSHVGRNVKTVEAPRPLKSASRSSLKNNFMLIEELIQLIENVAITLQSGVNNNESMVALMQNLRIHGPQLESASKDTLDRAFVIFRNASQDERLNIMTRLNLLELIELRAKGWEDNGTNNYYKTKHIKNVELPDHLNHHVHVDPTQAAVTAAFLSTSPTFGGAAAAATAAVIAAVGSAQQQHFLLGPGEVIRNSGKFPKPTKIPGKTYCKDEVVIRNADSGKVMGIKGRRVHMIEELSETIISFQRVNPGAKERLVQITGPNEEKINSAKQLIEDTIRRNASPVRLESAVGASGTGGGSCSSLASSNSDEVIPRTPGSAGNGGGLVNRLSFNSAQNFITATAAAQQIAAQQQQQLNAAAAANTSSLMVALNNASGNSAGGNVANAKGIRSNQQLLLHSFSTSDASVGEYSYSVNVGSNVLKITGDCFELVRIAKLVLDDYFSSAEFLASVEAIDGSIGSTPTTPLGPPQFMTTSTPLQCVSNLATDSGVGLNYIASRLPVTNHDGDDEVFADTNGLAKSGSQTNGLARSRRSHFSRKESAGKLKTNPDGREIEVSAPVTNNRKAAHLTYGLEELLDLQNSPYSWEFPANWEAICEKFPMLIRNQDINDESNRFDSDKYLELIKSTSKRNINEGDLEDDVTDTTTSCKTNAADDATAATTTTTAAAAAATDDDIKKQQQEDNK